MGEQQRRDAPGLDLLASGVERERAGAAGGTYLWVWRIAGLLGVGLLAVVAGPGLLSSPDPSELRPASASGPSAQAAPLVRPVRPTVVAPLRWAPRGPEVGSDFALAALVRLRAERQGVDRLLWAGSLDGRNHVVVVSYRRQPNQAGADSIEAAALRVRRVSDLATAHSETIGYVTEPDALVGLTWQGDDQHTRLLVLARPTLQRVQVSSVVDHDAVGRRWRTAALSDGVLVTDLGRHVDPVILVRVDRRRGPLVLVERHSGPMLDPSVYSDPRTGSSSDPARRSASSATIAASSS